MSCFKACFGGGGSSPRDQKERGSRYVVGGESQGGPSLATAADAAATSGLNGNGAASLATAAEAGGFGQAKESEQGAAASSGANVGSSTAVSSAANGGGGGGGVGGKGGGKIVASVGFTGPESTQRPISTISPLIKANSISSDGNSSNNAEFQALTTPKSIFHTTAQNHVVDQEATRPPRAAGGGKENLVKDSDSACLPGAKVFVSEQWLQVPYFSQFRGLTGVLTRRGVNGVTWYATFPGLLEQAFSTGMHGQHVLAYATESEHPSQPIVAAERMQEDAQAPPRNQQQQQQQQQASPPKPRASLPPLAAVGAVVPPPSAFVAQQPFAAHPPKPTAQDIHGMGSARKDRPSTARSRQLMGAPPLGSGRSQMSARGGKNLGLQVGRNACACAPPAMSCPPPPSSVVVVCFSPRPDIVCIFASREMAPPSLPSP
jgi:hypothetical protein